MQSNSIFLSELHTLTVAHIFYIILYIISSEKVREFLALLKKYNYLYLLTIFYITIDKLLWCIVLLI